MALRLLRVGLIVDRGRPGPAVDCLPKQELEPLPLHLRDPKIDIDVLFDPRYRVEGGVLGDDVDGDIHL